MSESTMPADLAEVIAVHREMFGGFTMTASAPEAPAEGDDGDQAPEKTFTQAEVDRIIADRLKREDVKGLKSKAAEFDKLAEARAQEAEAKAIRYQVAVEKGISETDADLFLTGMDEDTITAQADRLIERDGDEQKRGNYVPNEGKQPKNQSKDDPMREVTRQLFNRD